MLCNDFIKYSVISSMTFLLIACGGGGASEVPAPQTTLVLPIVEDSASTAEASTSAELKAPAGFDFETAYIVDFSVSLSTRKNERVFIAVCADFSEKMDDFLVDYDSCLLKVSMIKGAYADRLSVTNDKRKLLVALWFFDGTAPAYFPWTRGDSHPNMEKIVVSE